MKQRIVLIDCDNFFASCERIFRPDLKGKPVAVLSNNDGCIVARSREVKKLGIPMGIPYFKVREQLEKNDVKVFSSNFELYADISDRVMGIIEKTGYKVERYSIDESFIDFTELDDSEVTSTLTKLREEILLNTGIYVSIGVSTSKTLAKAAVEVVKKKKLQKGVLNWVGAEEVTIDAALSDIPLSDVWGVGRRLSNKFKKYRVDSALKFKKFPPKLVRKVSNVPGLRTWLELHGELCYPVEVERKRKKSVTYSRSFGNAVTSLEEIEEILAKYVAKAAKKMRDENRATKEIELYMKYKNLGEESERRPFSYSYQRVKLQETVWETSQLIKNATKLLYQVYRTGLYYKKLGVRFLNLEPIEDLQFQLWGKNSEEIQIKGSLRMLKNIDSINSHWGDRTVRIASEGYKKKSWESSSKMLSQRYTTRWDELLVVS